MKFAGIPQRTQEVEVASEPFLSTFADANGHGTVPAMIAVYCRDFGPEGEEGLTIPNTEIVPTLASLALSRDGKTNIRPLLGLNGPRSTSMAGYLLKSGFPEANVIDLGQKISKLDAQKGIARQLFDIEGHEGVVISTDDDVRFPRGYATSVYEHMQGSAPSSQSAVSGGRAMYFRPEGVPRGVVLARNIANYGLEVLAALSGDIRAHGNNQSFLAAKDGIISEAFREADPSVKYGDDVHLVEKVRTCGGRVIKMSLQGSLAVRTSGDRTQGYRDLLGAAADPEVRYRRDEVWGE